MGNNGTIGYIDSTMKRKWEKQYHGIIKRIGYKPVEVYEWPHLASIEDMSALIFRGYYYDRYFNHCVIEECKKHDVPIIFTDGGIRDELITITINGTKGTGTQYSQQYYNNTSRRKLLSKYIDMKEWARDRNSTTALVLTHNFGGYSSITKSIRQQHTQCKQVIDALEQKNCKVLISRHPKHGGSPGSFNKNRDTEKSFASSLEEAKLVVAWNTSAAALAIIKGVPVICFDEDSLSYDVSSYSLDEELRYPDREEWMNRLSWTQWTEREVFKGDFWIAIEPFIKK